MSNGYKLKNTISHVMNIQVYSKDGIYSSVISSTYWCVWCKDKQGLWEPEVAVAVAWYNS